MESDGHDASPSEVLARLIEALPLPVVGVDAGLCVVIWNHAATRTFGWTYDEVAGRRNPLLSAELLEEWEKRGRRLMKEGSLPSHMPVTRRRRDGSSIELLMRSAAVRASATSTPMCIAVFVDLSDMAARELRAQRARAEVDALSHDALRARTFREVVELTKRRAAAAMGAEHAEWLESADIPADGSIFSETLRSGSAALRGLTEQDFAAVPHLRERGFDFGGAAAVVVDDDRRALLTVYSRNSDLLDLGALPLASCAALASAAMARLNAEYASTEREVTVQLMADQLPAVVWTTDRELVFTAVRGRAGRDIGLESDSVGTSMHDFVGPGHAVLLQRMRHVVEHSESATYTYTFRKRVFDVRLDPLRGPDGSVSGTVGVAFDVTEREEARREIQHLAARITTAQEEQRRRIARELHDEMGRSLTALRLELDLLRREIGDSAPGRLESMAELVREAGETVRRVASELRPALLEDFGLIAALETEFAQWQKRTGIAVEASLPTENPPLDAGRSTALYRIIQEALTNTARHAAATRVNIRVNIDTHAVFVEIADDGRGITDREATNASSMGLNGVRERAVAFGGSCTIQGTPESGTRIAVRLPLVSA